MHASLSQHDINNLLGGMAGGAPAAGGGRDGGADADVERYDFRRPHRVSKDRLRTLEAIHERMAKGLEVWLVSRMRGQVDVRLQAVEQCSFGEFVQSLPAPCASYVFDVEGADGAQGVVNVGNELSYYFIDRIFGGSGEAVVLPRALSPVERLAVRTVAERTCHLLAEVWHDHLPLALRLAGFESSPEILNIATREEPVLLANFEVTVDAVASLVLVCLPFGLVEKYFQASGSRRVGGTMRDERAREEARLRAEQALRSTPVTVAARLPAFALTLRELSALAPGQVIATGIQCDAPLELLVGGRPRYTGGAGRVGRRLAVRIHAAVEPEDADQVAPSDAGAA